MTSAAKSKYIQSPTRVGSKHGHLSDNLTFIAEPSIIKLIGYVINL